MLKKFLNNANVIIEQSSFSNSVIICGQEIEKKDLTCHSEKIVSLKNYCENTRNGYSNLLAYLKNILKEKLDFVIKFS